MDCHLGLTSLTVKSASTWTEQQREEFTDERGHHWKPQRTKSPRREEQLVVSKSERGKSPGKWRGVDHLFEWKAKKEQKVP